MYLNRSLSEAESLLASNSEENGFLCFERMYQCIYYTFRSFSEAPARSRGIYGLILSISVDNGLTGY